MCQEDYLMKNASTKNNVKQTSVIKFLNHLGKKEEYAIF